MSDFGIQLEWQLTGDDFAWDKYSRHHKISFSGGQSIEASAAPEYFGDAALVNPEQSLVAALSSCHFLTFLAIAAKKKLKVLSYQDAAECTLEKNATGAVAVTHISLQPKVIFADPQPSPEVIEKLHQSAHRGCIIANSIKAEVSIKTE